MAHFSLLKEEGFAVYIVMLKSLLTHKIIWTYTFFLLLLVLFIIIIIISSPCYCSVEFF